MSRHMAVDTADRKIQMDNFEFRYAEDDFINVDSYDFHHRVWNGREPLAYVIHNFGTVLAVVFAEYFAYCEQDAMDAAADSGKLDGLQISDAELPDYQVGTDSEGNPEYEGIINLGNAGEPFASENLDMFTLPARLFASDPAVQKVIADNPAEE